MSPFLKISLALWAASVILVGFAIIQSNRGVAGMSQFFEYGLWAGVVAFVCSVAALIHEKVIEKREAKDELESS